MTPDHQQKSIRRILRDMLQMRVEIEKMIRDIRLILCHKCGGERFVILNRHPHNDTTIPCPVCAGEGE